MVQVQEGRVGTGAGVQKAGSKLVRSFGARTLKHQTALNPSLGEAEAP